MRHVVSKIIAPFGPRVDERPAVPTAEELVAEREERKEKKDERRSLKKLEILEENIV